MPTKKSVTSREEARQVEQRALESAPSFLQREDIDEVMQRFPSGVGFVRQLYRTEGGAEFTARGKELRYDEVIAQTNSLHLTMTKAAVNNRTGVLEPHVEVTTFEKLPFRTDACEMVRKHRFKSSEVLHALMGMVESYEVIFAIDPITEDQIKAEKAQGADARRKALAEADKNGFIAGDSPAFSGIPNLDDIKAPVASTEKKKVITKKEPELVEA